MPIPLFSPCLVFGIQKDTAEQLDLAVERELVGKQKEVKAAPREAVLVEYCVSVVRRQDPSFSKW